VGIVLLVLLSAVPAAEAQPSGQADTPEKPGLTIPTGPQSPLSAAFTYQGQLKLNNNPANGLYDLQFSLFDAEIGGNTVGSVQSVPGVSVTDGLFTVSLDFGPGIFQGQERWLQLAVRPSGGGSYTTLSPRQQLTAAPYAMSLMPGSVVTGTSGIVFSASNEGTGYGIRGFSAGGYGVAGRADCQTCAGVLGYSVDGYAVQGFSDNSYGMVAGSTNSTGVFGYSTNLFGVYGSSEAEEGVYGRSINQSGVHGVSDNGSGVSGQSNAASGSNGVYGRADCETCTGVSGSSTNGTGVAGSSSAPSIGVGVYGQSQSAENGWGVFGAAHCPTCRGVYGFNLEGTGVVGFGGTISGTTGTGVHGSANCASCTGVSGGSQNGRGVFGRSDASAGGAGVVGWSNCETCEGVAGVSSDGSAVYGSSSNGYAMEANGAAKQARGDGGWVKAIVRIGGGANITRCYNSQGTAPIDTPPCGFSVVQNAPGDYTIDFNFTVNDRFVSVTPEFAAVQAVIPTISFPLADQARVRTFSGGTTLIDSAFFLVIY
jgi:hypothetical protein